MITQETYEALKDARNKLKNWKGDTKKILFGGGGKHKTSTTF